MMNKIKELRKRQDWTQEYLGDLLGVQKATVSKYEKGKIDPSNDILQKIADLFNVSTDYLLGRESSISGDERRLLSDYQSLNAEGKQTLLNVLSGLKVTHSA